MLARRHRLPLGSNKIQGKKTHTPLFTLIVAENSLGHGRVGVVLPKKHLRTAVVRNKVKRMIVHALYPLLQTSSQDMVIISKPLVVGMVVEDLKKGVQNVVETIQNHQRQS